MNPQNPADAPALDELRDSLFSKWWFYNGGSLHGHWKYRRYSRIKDLAHELPRAAWDQAWEAALKAHDEAKALARETEGGERG